MAIIHVVMFEFKPNLSASEVHAACKRFLDLKDQCVHPTTKKPYIKSMVGGRQNSPETEVAVTQSHGFVAEFENEEDRAYYIKDDPAHIAFAEGMRELVGGKPGVMDFTPDVF